MKLHIAKDLSLPLEAVTESIAMIGRKGSGKSYAAHKLAEEMHRANAQFVVLDPVGIWYGLRLAADGKKPGLPIPVLGGLHGDIPLEPGAGALIANLVIDRGVSVVLDVSQFESDADKARFAHAFADRFYFRKKASPSAVHLFIEECQEFVPQNPQREEARMLHAFTRIAKIGRNFGIGISLISQRPQEVNKKVLNLTELLFCFQLTGPQERKTVEGWIAGKGIDEDIAGELPKLERGEPHVWSPAWLKMSRRVQIERRTTFDASSTPKVGKEAAARALSPIDLEQLRTDMAATIEKAKADDPRALRAENARLRAELAQKPAAAPASKGKPPGPRREDLATINALRKALETAMKFIVQINTKGFDADGKIDQEALKKALAGAAQQVATIVERHVDQRNKTLAALRQQGERALKDMKALLDADVTLQVDVQLNKPFTVTPTAARPARPPAKIDHTNPELMALAAAQRKILAVLIEAYPEALDRREASERAGLAPDAGHTNNMYGGLRSMGLIEYPTQGRVVAQPVLFLESR